MITELSAASDVPGLVGVLRNRKRLRDANGGRIYQFPGLVVDGYRHGFIQIAGGGHFVDSDVMESLERFSSHLTPTVEIDPGISQSLPVSHDLKEVL
ncbi:MAG: hypothetical protein EOQ50_19540 [Mesorhizobium sp.]|uniref:hypothetical protein n=1 Tax=Mesorhizobium sp. TaxID=1871066 RepID=UPI000FEA4EA3|nr:hypothetical protein [Mesorhizobium sp.]RWB72421.1 MAG: hypothetical protein EOQ50_19540 [Mesorhizobium sp.]